MTQGVLVSVSAVVYTRLLVSDRIGECPYRPFSNYDSMLSEQTDAANTTKRPKLHDAHYSDKSKQQSWVLTNVKFCRQICSLTHNWTVLKLFNLPRNLCRRVVSVGVHHSQHTTFLPSSHIPTYILRSNFATDRHVGKAAKTKIFNTEARKIVQKLTMLEGGHSTMQ